MSTSMLASSQGAGSVLPWSSNASESKRLWVCLAVVFCLFLPTAILVPNYELPEIDRKELEKPPANLAKVIIEKKIPPKVEKKPEPKPEEKKPEKKEEKKPEPKEKPKEEKPKEKPKPKLKKKQTVEQAREVAKTSGLLALQDDLADMREALDTSALSKKVTPSVAKTIAPKGTSESIDRSLLAKRSGGIDTSGLSVAAETVALKGKKATELEAREDEIALAEASKKSPGSGRSSEEIRRVFGKNKSSIFAIYNRALRKNPSLQGKVLLELVIESSGVVSSCKIVSSELNDKRLERKIVSRVKLINFGKKAVKKSTIQYSLDFVPT